MPVIFQDHIERADLRRHPGRRYLFGDNEQRAGSAGQAAACRGEPNAIGIATKRSPSRTSDAYWSDADHDRAVAVIDTNLAPAFAFIREVAPSSAQAPVSGPAWPSCRRAPRASSRISGSESST